LEARGHAVRYVDAPTDDLTALDPLACDLMVVLGGPIGVDDAADYPFLNDELRLVERRLAEDRPILGICLGSQIMARALGARVYPAKTKEIGWTPVTLAEAGLAGPLRHLDGDTPVLHWHGDNFDLPDGAERLARTEVCPNQAFAYGRTALGLQFHAEACGPALERWFVGHTVEIGATPGVSVARLRADTERHSAAMESHGTALFADWLDRVGL
jgi:GMP synthase (glutamine-hydrolysing)